MSSIKAVLVSVVKARLFNIVAFNVLWLSCVVGHNSFLWLSVPLLLAYLWFLVETNSASLSRILVPAAIGILTDTALALAGVFQFQDSLLIIPLWLVVLWIGFATTLSQSLSVFGKNLWIAACAGAVAFPFNYGVGERLGAVSFGETYLESMMILSLLWAALFPLCFYLNRVAIQQISGDRNVAA